MHNLRPSGTLVSKRSVMEDVDEEDVFQPNKRFRKARHLDEESGYKNKWPAKLFEEWKIQSVGEITHVLFLNIAALKS